MARKNYIAQIAQTLSRTWLQACPHCKQVWLIGKAQESEAYQCKACKHNFAISENNVPLKTPLPSAT